MTALGRLTSHAIKEPGQYLRWPLTIITVLAIGFVVWRLATSGRSTAGDVWLKLESAKTSEDRVNLAKEYPKTTASTWALFQAAKDYYSLALERPAPEPRRGHADREEGARPLRPGRERGPARLAAGPGRGARKGASPRVAKRSAESHRAVSARRQGMARHPRGRGRQTLRDRSPRSGGRGILQGFPGVFADEDDLAATRHRELAFVAAWARSALRPRRAVRMLPSAP